MKKGFTIMELLATIVLLGIILLLAATSISSVSEKIKERNYYNLASTIEVAAEKYASETGVEKVFVETLILEGFVEPDNEELELLDPRDANELLNCYVVSIDEGNAEMGTEPKMSGEGCDDEIMISEVIKIAYKDSSGKEHNFDPTNDKWINETITLIVKETGVKDIDLDNENTKFSWTMPLAPDEVYTDRTLLLEQTAINNEFSVQVTTPDGAVYIADQLVKIDKVAPKVYNFVDANPESWAPDKKVSFQITDDNSGIKRYGISVKEGQEPAKWNTIANAAKELDINNMEFDFRGYEDGAKVYIWTEDVAGNINMEDADAVLELGFTFDNIDGNIDLVEITASPTLAQGYAKSVTLNARAKDTKSGLVGIRYNTGVHKNMTHTTSGWTKITKTNDEINFRDNGLPRTVSADGTYCAYVLDAVNNIAYDCVTVNNIDLQGPTGTLVVNSEEAHPSSRSHSQAVILKATFKDAKSGVYGYVIDSNSSAYTNMSMYKRVYNPDASGTYTVTQRVTENSRYYLHLIDNLGNTSVIPLSTSGGRISHLVESRTETIYYPEDRYSSSMSGTYRDYSAVHLVSAQITYGGGRITNQYLNNGIFTINVTGGRAFRDQEWQTFTDTPRSYRAYSYEVCTRYECNDGGTLRGEKCTGRDYTLRGKNFRWQCTCEDGTYSECTAVDGWPYTECDPGYWRRQDEYEIQGVKKGDSCSRDFNGTNYGLGKCYWSGDYYADCDRYVTEYECDNRYDVLDGNRCYYCEEGDINRSGTRCTWEELVPFTYYTYEVSFTYLRTKAVR